LGSRCSRHMWRCGRAVLLQAVGWPDAQGNGPSAGWWDVGSNAKRYCRGGL